MAIYFAFRVDALARRILYLDQIRGIESFFQTELAIARFRASVPSTPMRAMPL
jgi:hypothetical protein